MAKPEKTTCPITATTFSEKAPPTIKVNINGRECLAQRKEFQTGSFGYYLNEKVVIEVDGKPLTLTAGMNLIVVGSKDAARK